MSDANTTKKIAERPRAAEPDWSRFDAMSEAERHAAAPSDPDAQPLTEDDLKRMRRTPRAKIIRRALRLSQEECAARYRIPLGTLRDWEQGRAQPDQAARADLTVIAREPEAARCALEPIQGTRAADSAEAIHGGTSKRD
jgi:putative transcriptional regulator